jgi:hypothetical protein
MEQANSTANLIFQTTLLLGIPRKIIQISKHYSNLYDITYNEKMHK